MKREQGWEGVGCGWSEESTESLYSLRHLCISPLSSGIKVGLGFFEDIVVPPYGLCEPRSWVASEEVCVDVW